MEVVVPEAVEEVEEEAADLAAEVEVVDLAEVQAIVSLTVSVQAGRTSS